MRLAIGQIAYKEIITKNFKSNQIGQMGWAQKSILSNNNPKERKKHSKQEILNLGT